MREEQHPQALLGGALGVAGADATHPQRRVRLLHRTRHHGAGRHLDEFAVELDLLLGQESRDGVDPLLPLGPGLFRVDAEAIEFGRRRRATRTHVDPPAGQAIQHRHPLGDADRVVVGRRGQRQTEPEPDVFGLIGGRTEEHLGADMCEKPSRKWCSVNQT